MEGPNLKQRVATRLVHSVLLALAGETGQGADSGHGGSHGCVLASWAIS